MAALGPASLCQDQPHSSVDCVTIRAKLGCKRAFMTIGEACCRGMTGNVGSWLSNNFRLMKAFVPPRRVMMLMIVILVESRLDFQHCRIIEVQLHIVAIRQDASLSCLPFGMDDYHIRTSTSRRTSMRQKSD